MKKSKIKKEWKPYLENKVSDNINDEVVRIAPIVNKFIADKNWDDLISFMTFYMNCSVEESIQIVNEFRDGLYNDKINGILK